MKKFSFFSLITFFTVSFSTFAMDLCSERREGGDRRQSFLLLRDSDRLTFRTVASHELRNFKELSKIADDKNPNLRFIIGFQGNYTTPKTDVLSEPGCREFMWETRELPSSFYERIAFFAASRPTIEFFESALPNFKNLISLKLTEIESWHEIKKTLMQAPPLFLRRISFQLKNDVYFPEESIEIHHILRRFSSLKEIAFSLNSLVLDENLEGAISSASETLDLKFIIRYPAGEDHFKRITLRPIDFDEIYSGDLPKIVSDSDPNLRFMVGHYDYRALNNHPFLSWVGVCNCESFSAQTSSVDASFYGRITSFSLPAPTKEFLETTLPQMTSLQSLVLPAVDSWERVEETFLHAPLSLERLSFEFRGSVMFPLEIVATADGLQRLSSLKILEIKVNSFMPSDHPYEHLNKVLTYWAQNFPRIRINFKFQSQYINIGIHRIVRNDDTP